MAIFLIRTKIGLIPLGTQPTHLPTIIVVNLRLDQNKSYVEGVLLHMMILTTTTTILTPLNHPFTVPLIHIICILEVENVQFQMMILTTRPPIPLCRHILFLDHETMSRINTAIRTNMIILIRLTWRPLLPPPRP